MRADWTIAVIGFSLALGGCGKIFPPGERLLPITYGPPFGSALADNRPHHPHNPAPSERHAQADAAEARHYRSHQACHAALSATVAGHSGGRVQRLSMVETIGHYQAAGIVHEWRCSDYVLTTRSWCTEAADGSGHGDAHKRAEPACGAGNSAH